LSFLFLNDGYEYTTLLACAAYSRQVVCLKLSGICNARAMQSQTHIKHSLQTSARVINSENYTF
jgi:hypothetical protein